MISLQQSFHWHFINNKNNLPIPWWKWWLRCHIQHQWYNRMNTISFVITELNIPQSINHLICQNVNTKMAIYLFPFGSGGRDGTPGVSGIPRCLLFLWSYRCKDYENLNGSLNPVSVVVHSSTGSWRKPRRQRRVRHHIKAGFNEHNNGCARALVNK